MSSLLWPLAERKGVMSTKEDILNALIDSAEARHEEMFGFDASIGCLQRTGVLLFILPLTSFLADPTCRGGSHKESIIWCILQAGT